MLIAIDQLFNALFAGDPDETISSRLGKWARAQKSGWRRIFVWIINPILNWLDKGHCQKSIEEDEGKDSVIE